MIVSLHFNWLPENALNLAYQVWLPDVDINFLDIKIDTTTTTKRKKVRRMKERKTRNRIIHRRGGYQVVKVFESLPHICEVLIDQA